MRTGGPIGKRRLQGHVPRPWLAPKPCLSRRWASGRRLWAAAYVQCEKGVDDKTLNPPWLAHGGGGARSVSTVRAKLCCKPQARSRGEFSRRRRGATPSAPARQRRARRSARGAMAFSQQPGVALPEGTQAAGRAAVRTGRPSPVQPTPTWTVTCGGLAQRPSCRRGKPGRAQTACRALAGAASSGTGRPGFPRVGTCSVWTKAQGRPIFF